MNIQALGQRIKNLRAKKDISQDELSAKSGVARRLIQRLEGGEGNPTISTILALSNFFGEAPSSFIDLANEADTLPDFAAIGELLTALSNHGSDYQAIIVSLIRKNTDPMRGRPAIEHLIPAVEDLIKLF